jgi:hypothetical protein
MPLKLAQADNSMAATPAAIKALGNRIAVGAVG